MAYFVVNQRCNGCLACVMNCPANALDWKDEAGKRTIMHNMARCARCANCWRICPEGAIEFQYFLDDVWDEVVSLDLTTCSVCGEPVCTTAMGKTLVEERGIRVVPLCPKHKQESFVLRKGLMVNRV